MSLGERIEWINEGSFIGIERVETTSFLLLCDGKLKKVFDAKDGRIITDFRKLDFLEKKIDADFATLEKKKCFKTLKGCEYFVLDNKKIIQKNKNGYISKINPDLCFFNAKNYKFKVYDLVVGCEEENTVFFVGERSHKKKEIPGGDAQTFIHKGLFCFPVIDFC